LISLISPRMWSRGALDRGERPCLFGPGWEWRLQGDLAAHQPFRTSAGGTEASPGCEWSIGSITPSWPACEQRRRHWLRVERGLSPLPRDFEGHEMLLALARSRLAPAPASCDQDQPVANGAENSDSLRTAGAGKLRQDGGQRGHNHQQATSTHAPPSPFFPSPPLSPSHPHPIRKAHHQ
jgi:hypothetical protein